MVEYTFTLNKGLAACLWKLTRRETDYIEIRTLGLTTSQWTNFQKLRYWGLIEKPTIDDTGGRGGKWRVTAKGLRFVCGELALQRKVVLYRNKVVRFEDVKVYFNDINDTYLWRSDYIEQIKQPRPDEEMT